MDKAQGERKASRDAERKAAMLKGMGPELLSVTVTPEAPKLEDSVEVEHELSDSSGEVTLRHRWYVNDQVVLGVERPGADVKALRARKGDRIVAEVIATDSEKREDSVKSAAVRVANTPPEITSNLSWGYGLTGSTVKAEDVDGDPLKWTLEGGVPGASISGAGRLRIDQVDVEKDFDGELVVVATDPDGGRAELHVPVRINGAKAATREEVEQKEVKYKTYQQATEEELVKATEKAAEAISNMSPAEFEKYVREREARGE